MVMPPLGAPSENDLLDEAPTRGSQHVHALQRGSDVSDSGWQTFMEWNAEWATPAHRACPRPHWRDNGGRQCVYCGSHSSLDSWQFIDIESDLSYYLMHGASPCYGDLVCPCIIEKMREWTKVAATRRLHEAVIMPVGENASL